MFASFCFTVAAATCAQQLWGGECTCLISECFWWPSAVLQDAGRLLYIGQNEWTHVNCALWSAEVFEDDDGSLKNVHVAVIRGKQLVSRNRLGSGVCPGMRIYISKAAKMFLFCCYNSKEEYWKAHSMSPWRDSSCLTLMVQLKKEQKPHMILHS